MADKKAFGSGFLYAEDLIRGGEFIEAKVVIESFVEAGVEKAANGKLIDKPIIGFKGAEKRLVLNATNVSVLKYVTGEQPGEGWVGKQITLQARLVDGFSGSKEFGLRVMPPIGATMRRNLLKRIGEKAVLTKEKQ